jgi:hypothetical protein
MVDNQAYILPITGIRGNLGTLELEGKKGILKPMSPFLCLLGNHQKEPEPEDQT